MIRLITYVWLGMVLGVSFLATPIKFRAESLTLPVALDVGRTTFHAFGKVEWVLAVVLAVALYRGHNNHGSDAADWALVGLVLVIVLVQSFWLIPRLDVRVASIINGITPPKSNLHMIYAGSEFAKGLLLLFIGLWTGSKAA